MAREGSGPPPDPRLAGVRALRRFLPLPGEDGEAKAEAKLLGEIDEQDRRQSG